MPGKEKTSTNRHKVCIIGHFGGDKFFTDGQTVKTKEIRELLLTSGYEVSSVDTYYLRKNPFSILRKIKKAFRNDDAIVLVVSMRGYSILSPLLARMNRRAKLKMFDFVIGGTRYKIFDKKSFYKNVAKSFTRIYVETDRIKREYFSRGIKNVEVIPNFKSIEKFPPKENYIKDGELHACTFSRVIKEKGISDAIDAIKIANNCGDGKKYYLDVFGKIDERYKDEFLEKVKKSDGIVKYGGELKPDESSKIINHFDVLLFPTYWKSEGFPGTIIDALFAAVPIIATDWNDNFCILQPDMNAIKVNIMNPADLAKAMQKIVNDKAFFLKMSSNNSILASKYSPEYAKERILKDMEGVVHE